MTRERGPPEEVHGIWQFSPRPRFEARREEAAARERRLLSALRVGHGLRVPLEVTVESGPEAQVRLWARSAAAERWVTRALFAGFEPESWDRVAPPKAEEGNAALWARRCQGWPHPLRSAAEPTAWVDSWALTLATRARGVTVRLRAAPLPDVAPRWWESRPPEPAAARVPPTRRAGAARSPPPKALSGVDGTVGRPLFWSLRVGVELRAGELATPELERLAVALGGATRNADGNGLRFGRLPRLGVVRDRGSPVSDEELLLALPSPDCRATGAGFPATPGEAVLPLGRTPTGSVVGPGIEPGQGRHLAVLGETGMGKSSLLVALALRVSRTHGLLLFDPLGETAAALDQELPRARAERVLAIDPVGHPRRINALAGIAAEESDPVRSERRLGDLVHAFRRVRAGRFPESGFWGPRLDEMLNRALRAAAALERGTVSDAHTLLATGARTHRDVPAEAMGPLRELAERMRERPEDGDGARRLLHEVVRSPVLERMLCARDPDLDPSELVAPGRIVLLSGNAARVGESTARYLLSVYLALVWSELLARAPAAKTFVVLDEAQWFSHESLAEMLRLGRRENVHVILSTQAVASLPVGVPEAVWTNVADFVAFRGSPDEAREFARIAPGVATDALLALPRGRAAVLLGKGREVHWVRTSRIPSGPAEGGSRTGPVDRGAGGPGERGPGPSQGAPPGSEDPRRRAQGGRAVAGPEKGAPPSVDDVLRYLRARAAEQAGGSFRVELAALRPAVDPDGSAVRSAGALLGRVGALLATERTERGATWVLAPERIPAPAGERDGTPSAEVRERRQDN